MLVFQAGLLVNCVLPKSTIHWSHSRSFAARISRQQNVESEVQADQPTIMEQEYGEAAAAGGPAPSSSTSSPSSAGDNTSNSSFTTESKASFSAPIDKNIKKAVLKTAATFAPRASAPQKNKNPAAPGTALYTVFELQGYASMLLGGALSYNLIFPSNEPDIWRLMGMWSIWMFTIPSLRARDCSKEEKEALNYLFLLIPLINVILPFFWKSFSLVWSADTFAFFSLYAWKMRWLQKTE